MSDPLKETEEVLKKPHPGASPIVAKKAELRLQLRGSTNSATPLSIA
jgi:hypothetical protein